MKYKFRKGLAVGAICLLILVSIPMVSGEDILYPREEGPYNVIISGKCSGMGGGLYTSLLHFWPLWFLIMPFLHIMWHFQPGSVFFVNGEKQDIVYPATIWLDGFKGYGQSLHMFVSKEYASAFIYLLTGFQPTPRARVIGRCAEVQVSDAR
ncbi:MAG: hypothetical protein ACOC80_10045 [Petrotogales bacterium]